MFRLNGSGKVAGALALLAFSMAPLGAQVVYNNGSPDGVFGNEMTQWVQAEDFTLTGATTLTGVTFWSLGYAASYHGSIVWEIYSNVSGAPGSSISSGTATPTTTSYPSATCCGFNTGMQLDFALPNILLGGGTYWLGLHNGPLTTIGRDDFYWASTAGNATGTGQEDVVPFDGGWLGNAAEHAFQLEGNPESVVPEPATMTLLATGLVGLAGMRRRRRKV